MNIYHYNPLTGEKIGSSIARLDPVEKKPMIPAHATTDAPPSTGSKQVAVREGNAWTVKPDYRGTTYWLPDGSRGEITAIGIEPPAGAVFSEPEKILTDNEIIAMAERDIDLLCDTVYTQYASRATRYEQKYQESLRYVAAGYPGTVSANDYPYLVYESAKRGLTKREQADLIIAMAVAFNQFGAHAEAARAELPGAVAAGIDTTEKQNAADAIVSAINTLAQALEA